MNIRLAKKKDGQKVLELLSQVLELHAKIRPDIFISGTTKYNLSDFALMLKDKEKPIYVAVDDKDQVLGYAFCQIKEQPFSSNMVQFKSLFIDDLCVDENYRGQGLGKEIFNFLKEEAKKLDCYEISLNVWAGNDKAQAFYDKMGLKPKETQMEYIL